MAQYVLKSFVVDDNTGRLVGVDCVEFVVDPEFSLGLAWREVGDKNMSKNLTATEKKELLRRVKSWLFRRQLNPFSPLPRVKDTGADDEDDVVEQLEESFGRMLGKKTDNIAWDMSPAEFSAEDKSAIQKMWFLEDV